jgi:biopolymer transport protein ExbB
MNLNNGLFNVWAQGDAVTRCVLVLLLAMSLASWMVIVLKTLDLRRLSQQARQLKSFWHASDFDAGLKTLNGEANPFHALALEGRQAAAHLSDDHSASAELHEGFDLSDWLTRSLTHSIDDATAELQSGLAILASVGSTAPFVGLFGTVWGIYHALMAIGLAGQATIDKVAGPIGETLIMTALGLAVAIPAVLGYNALVRGNKGVLLKLNRFAHDLHAFFVTGARVGAR